MLGPDMKSNYSVWTLVPSIGFGLKINQTPQFHVYVTHGFSSFPHGFPMVSPCFPHFFMAKKWGLNQGVKALLPAEIMKHHPSLLQLRQQKVVPSGRSSWLSLHQKLGVNNNSHN